MKTNKIIVGDALGVLEGIPDSFVQAVITDPPYYNVLDEPWDTQWENEDEYLDWGMKWVKQCMRILKDDGLFFCFGQIGKRQHVFIHLMSELCKAFQFHDLIIWDRAVGYNERRDSFTPAYEMIIVLRKSDKIKFIKDAVRVPYDKDTIQEYIKDDRYKDKDARYKHLSSGKYATNILRTPSLKGTSSEKCGHPSQKPHKLIQMLVRCSTDTGDIVLDPFMGSGTTAEVAQTLGRNWIGIEKEQKYIDIANERLQSTLF